MRQSGIDALVELTTIGLGRDPRGVADIAAHSGLHIVLATGIHREAHYPPEHWVHRTATEELAELFLRDITEGCDGTDYSGPREQPTRIRAGVIKVGAGYWSISPLERRVFEAAGEAHRSTDAPVACHLELGTAAWEVLEALEAAGIAPERIMLAHVDRNPDPGLHAELAAAGAYLGYDGMARFKYWPDSMLLDCLLRVARRRRSPAARRRWCPAYGIPLVWWFARDGVRPAAFRSAPCRDGGRGAGAPNTN